MKVNQKTSTINQSQQRFGAIPVSLYDMSKRNSSKKLAIFELEPSDLDFLKKFKNKVENDIPFKENFKTHYLITMDTLTSIINGLEIKSNFKLKHDKSISMVGIGNGKINSLFQGNVPKINLSDNSITHSTRNKKHETEIDWLATIPNEFGDIPRASAPSLVAEFFKYCTRLQPKIKTIYCLSEIPEKCSRTISFYKKLGFENVGDSYIKMETTETPILITRFNGMEHFEYQDDDVIPLEISIDKSKKTLKNISKRFGRIQQGVKKSVDLSEVVF